MQQQDCVHTNRGASVRLCAVMPVEEFTAPSAVINGDLPARSFNTCSSRPHEGTRGGSDVLAERGAREVGREQHHHVGRSWGRLAGRFRCSCALG